MTWNFNFCAPSVPNDPSLEFHRTFQISALLVLLLIYVIIHTYYFIFGPLPLSEEEKQAAGKPEEQSSEMSEKKEKKSEQSSQSDGKSLRSENESYITFKNRKASYRNLPKSAKEEKKMIYTVVENVTIEEVQNYFPIVFGHFAIVVVESVLYTPYFQQSVAIFIYPILSVMLTISNAQRKKILVRVIWTFMCLIIIYLCVMGMAEVAQSNYSRVEKECFLKIYTPAY